jgi:hypothetical protein
LFLQSDLTIDNATGDPYIKFKTVAQEYVVRIDQSDSEKFQIRDTTNSATRITLDTSGNVGIGTTSPSSALSISKSMGAAFIADFINPAVNGHGLLIQAGGTSHNGKML